MFNKEVRSEILKDITDSFKIMKHTINPWHRIISEKDIPDFTEEMENIHSDKFDVIQFTP